MIPSVFWCFSYLAFFTFFVPANGGLVFAQGVQRGEDNTQKGNNRVFTTYTAIPRFRCVAFIIGGGGATRVAFSMLEDFLRIDEGS